MKRVRFSAYDQVAYVPVVGTKKVRANGESKTYSAEELQLQILTRKKAAWEIAREKFIRLEAQYTRLLECIEEAKAEGDDQELEAYRDMLSFNVFEKKLCAMKMLCMRYV
jgi:hypothetical protein